MKPIRIQLSGEPKGMADEPKTKRFGAALHFSGASALSTSARAPFCFVAKNRHDTDVVNLFIKAVANNGPDAAAVYLSKNLKAIGSVDFDELKKVFRADMAYKYLSKVRFTHLPEQIVTNSILVMSDTIKNSSIVHVYMIREPDIHGNWKICGIERE